MILVGWYTAPTPVKDPEPSLNEGGDLLDEGESEEVPAEKTPEPTPYLASDEDIPSENIFTEGMILTGSVTLYAWWQELNPDAKIITFISYWTENAAGVTRQALPGVGDTYTVKNLPKVTGGSLNYHPVDANGGKSDTTWFTDISGGDVFTTATAITGDMSVYGHWKGDDWKVTFDFNGGTSGVGETSYTETITYSKDTPNTARLSESKTPSAPSGYQGFLGWFTDKRANINGSGVPAAGDTKRFLPGETVVDKEHSGSWRRTTGSPRAESDKFFAGGAQRRPRVYLSRPHPAWSEMPH